MIFSHAIGFLSYEAVLKNRKLHSHSAARDEDEACDEGNCDLCDENVEISFLVGHLADTQQSDLRALMRQGIQCARSDGSDSVDLFQIGSKFDIGVFERVKRYTHTAGSGSAGTCTDGHGQHDEDQRGNIPGLQGGYQIRKALCLLDDAAEADDNGGIQNGDTGIGRSLVEEC